MDSTAPETAEQVHDQEESLPSEFSLAQATAPALPVLKVSAQQRWACRQTPVVVTYPDSLVQVPYSCTGSFPKSCDSLLAGGDCTGCWPWRTTAPWLETHTYWSYPENSPPKYTTLVSGPDCRALVAQPTPSDQAIGNQNLSGERPMTTPLSCGQSTIQLQEAYAVCGQRSDDPCQNPSQQYLVSKREAVAPNLNYREIEKVQVSCRDLFAVCKSGTRTLSHGGKTYALDCSSVVPTPTPTPTPPPECAKNNTVRDLTNPERLALINGIKKTKPFVNKTIQILGCWKTMPTSKRNFSRYFAKYFNNPLNATSAATATAKLKAINRGIDALLADLNTPKPTQVKTYLNGLCFGLGFNVSGTVTAYQGPDFTQVCRPDCRVAPPTTLSGACKVCDSSKGVSEFVGFRSDIFVKDVDFVWKHALVVHEASHFVLSNGAGARTGDFVAEYCGQYGCNKIVPPNMGMSHADAYAKFATDTIIQSMSCK